MGMAAITKIIEKSAEKPGTYNFTNLRSLNEFYSKHYNFSTKINLEYKSFSLGEEFEDLGFDGKKHKITFDMADENTLSEHHIRLESNDRETYFYNIDGNYLVLVGFKLSNSQSSFCLLDNKI